MNNRFLATTVVTVFGLVFLIGSGCSNDDKSAKLLAQQLKNELEVKQKELDCKVAVLGKICNSGDTLCEQNKTNRLAACSAAAASATSISTSTATASDTATATSTSGSTSTTTI